MTLDDPERPIRTLGQKNRFTEPPENVNKGKPKLSAAKCQPVILVSRNIRFVRIFPRVP